MDWMQLLTLLGGGTGIAFLVRQLFAFTKFVLKRKAVVDVNNRPNTTGNDLLAMARAMDMIDPSTRERERSDHGGTAKKPSEVGKPRLLPGLEDSDPLAASATA